MSAQPTPATTPTAPPQADAGAARHLLGKAVEAIGSVVRGHPHAVRLVMAAVIGRGHVLLEDVPGVGKTTLARAVARVLGSSFARVQFTADMLPSDVLGLQILDPTSGQLVFRRGPIFAEMVLADEINRASPKTQSAMLEAMGEGRITVDDATHSLPQLFSVLATQNPVEHHGAYPLPESQLDRFMLCLSLGYPPREEERALLLRPQEPGLLLAGLAPVCGPADVLTMQQLARQVVLSDAVAAYMMDLVEATRRHPDILLGISPRGSLALARMARAWAFVQGRDFVLPDDVQQLAPAVLAHRLALVGGSGNSRAQALATLRDVVEQVDVPR